MKAIKIITCILFAVIICIPVVKFNFTPNAISEIDNRNLAENPFKTEGEDLTTSVENYVNDRIGFRSEMINAYTVLNDKLFNKMVHPSYTYGKDGYVFGSGITTSGTQLGDFHLSFAKMVKEISDYCAERNVPFVFVFNPAKPAVLSEYIADGINYSRQWVDDFLNVIDEYGINYVDNTVTLKNAHSKGEVVFNQKYDANHWNDLGAFYGVNAILTNLKTMLPNTHINSLDEFNIVQELQTSLPVSKFTINENVPKFSAKISNTQNIADLYREEIELDPSYKGFGYYINSKTGCTNRALVFQGSYMNGMGYKFLVNSFNEYIHVHDYQNVLNFDYYYNIFKPDCVIFEVAEYTFSDTYFNYEKMKSFKLQSTMAAVSADEITVGELDNEKVEVITGKTLTKIVWNTGEAFDGVWLSLDSEYDMMKTDTGYSVTIETEIYNKNKDKLKINALNGNIMKEYL